MNFELETLPEFEKEIRQLSKKYRSLKDDLRSFFEDLQTNPTQGINLGKDFYKIRLKISSKNQGKSGGARVITCVKVVKMKVYLIAIYDKSEKASMSDFELINRLSKVNLD